MIPEEEYYTEMFYMRSVHRKTIKINSEENILGILVFWQISCPTTGCKILILQQPHTLINNLFREKLF
jgi:hypothetical protein